MNWILLSDTLPKKKGNAFRLPAWLPLVVLVASVIGVYANAIPGGFVLVDDHIYSDEVRSARTLAQLGAYFKRPNPLDQTVAPVETKFYRPIFYVYGALLYWLGGREPWVWHAANIAVHAITSCLALVTLRRLFGLAPAPAFLSALIWAVHPVHTTAVADATPSAYALTNALLLVAVLVTCGWWPKSSPWPTRVPVATGAFALALLTHELGLMAPALAVFALAVSPTLGKAWRYPSRLPRGTMVCVGALALTASCYVVLRFTVIGTGRAGQVQGLLEGLGSRLLQSPEILLRYMTLLAFPVRLTIDRTQDVPVPSNFLSPRFLFFAALLAVLIWCVARTASRVPCLVFGCGWFLLAYFPVSNTLIPFYAIMGEQYIYMASLGIVAAAVATASLAAQGLRMRQIAVAVGIIIAATFAGRTIVRNRDWRDDLTFNLATVKASPWSTVYHSHLGNSYHIRGELALAEREYRIALGLNPSYPFGYFSLGVLAAERGNLDQAEISFRKAITLRPDFTEAYYNLGVVAHRRGRDDEARSWLKQASALKPPSAEFDLYLGLTLLRLGSEGASKHLHRFLALAPDHPQAPAIRAMLETHSAPSHDSNSPVPAR